MLVHSTNKSFTKQPVTRVCQRSRCHTCEFINPLTEIRSNFIVRDHFTCTPENLVKLGEVSGVDLVSTCEAYPTTLLRLLWHNPGGGGGYSQKNWVGVCGLLPKTLTLFMTKICDFPYPIYDLTKNLIPYL